MGAIGIQGRIDGTGIIVIGSLGVSEAEAQLVETDQPGVEQFSV